MATKKPVDQKAGLAEVKAFLSKVPAEQRAVLEVLRANIRAAAPDATERIGYGVPAFYHNGRALVSYAAAKTHLSFFVQSPAVMDAHKADLKGYDTAKGTVRFQAAKPLPAALVKKLVKARIKEIDAT
jgi:uncharacterized protein YdhG (YjbR/CyaY superfamily)